MSLTSYQAAPPRVSNMSIQGTKANPKNDCRCTIACKEALAATNCVGKIYAARFERGKQTFQRSSVVERSAVNRLVVGSNPTAGANLRLVPENVAARPFVPKPLWLRGFTIGRRQVCRVKMRHLIPSGV